MSEITLNLSVGSTLKLESMADDALSDLHSEIIDYAQDQSIIMAHPKKDNVPVQVDQGDRFFVSLKQGNADVTFETEVVSVLSNPYPQVHTTYPNNIRTGSLRKSNRIPAADANIRLSGQHDNDTPSLSIIDISCSGACLVTDKSLGLVDDQFEIEIQVESGQPYIGIDCMIRYVRAVTKEDHRMFHHGVAFIGMNAEAQLFLWKFFQASQSIHQQSTDSLNA